MVSLPAGLKKAMVYIMDPTRSPGTPSTHYIDTIYKGYTDFGFDYRYLKESLYLSKKEMGI